MCLCSSFLDARTRENGHQLFKVDIQDMGPATATHWAESVRATEIVRSRDISRSHDAVLSIKMLRASGTSMDLDTIGSCSRLTKFHTSDC